MEPNPFDQFDEAPKPTTMQPRQPEAASGGDSGNPFDQFDEAPVTKRDMPTTLSQEAVPEGESSYLGDIGSELGTGINKIGQAIAEGNSPIQEDDSMLDKGLKFLDEAVPFARPGRRAVAGAIEGGFGALTELAVPDALQEAGGKAFSWLGDQAMKVPGVPETMSALKQFAEDNPYAAEYFGDAATLGSLATPGTKVLKNNVKMGTKLEQANKPHLIKSRQAKAEHALTPPNRKDSFGRWSEDSKGRLVYEPTQLEQEAAKQLAREKDFAPKRSATHNRNVAEDAARRKANELDATIEKRGNPSVDMDSLKADLKNSIKNMDKQEGFLSLRGDAKKQAKDLLKRAAALLDSSDGTALGLLNVRREMDRIIEKEMPSVFNPDFSNASIKANKLVRDKLNATINAAVGDDVVAKSLKEQSRLYSARDLLNARAHSEAATTWGRLFRKFEDFLPEGFHAPSTALATVATGTAGAAALAGSPLIASLATAAAAGIAAKGAYNYLRSPEGRQVAIKLAKAMENNAELAAERAALVQLIEQAKEDTTTGGGF